MSTVGIAPNSKCLIDTDVWSEALHLGHTDAGLRLTWWGMEEVAVYRQQNWLNAVPRPDETRKYESWLALPSLGRLFSEETIRPVVSDAIEAELNMTPHSATNDFFGFDFAKAERISTGLATSSLTQPSTKRTLEPLLRSNTDQRLTELRRHLGDAHLWDIYHIWTAECSGIDFFVSFERRFRNQFEAMRARHRSRVSILSPREVIDRFGYPVSDHATLTEIRDIFQQQRLIPLCQLKWPRSWFRRTVFLLTGRCRLRPLQGQLHVPDTRELLKALWAMEIHHKNRAVPR